MANGDGPKLIIPGGDDWKKRDEPAKPAPASGGSGAPAQPSLAVDADWKAQAQAEKDKLAAAAEAKAAQAAKSGGRASAGGGGASAGGRELPKADFPALLETLVAQALLYMGAFPDPQTGRAVVSLEYARFHIDLLSVLAEKTKGNLTEEESKAVTETVAALQMQFVEVTHAVSKMLAERRAGAAGAGGPAGLAGGGLGAGLTGPGLGG